MKVIRLLGILLLVFLISCGPSTRVDDSPAGITSTFTATIGDQTLRPSNGLITYAAPAFDISFQLDTRNVTYFFQNKSAETIRILFDDSAFVLPDGRTSRAVPSSVTWVTRTNPQAPSVIPANAPSRDVLTPVDNLTFETRPPFGNYGLGASRFFGFPNANPVSFRLVLAIEVGGQRTTRDFAFTAPAFTREATQ